MRAGRVEQEDWGDEGSIDRIVHIVKTNDSKYKAGLLLQYKTF